LRFVPTPALVLRQREVINSGLMVLRVRTTAELEDLWRFYGRIFDERNSSGDGGDQQVLIHYFAHSQRVLHELPVDYNAFAWELDPRHAWWYRVKVLHKVLDVHLLTPAQRYQWQVVVSRRANAFFSKRMRQAHLTDGAFTFRHEQGPTRTLPSGLNTPAKHSPAPPAATAKGESRGGRFVLKANKSYAPLKAFAWTRVVQKRQKLNAGRGPDPHSGPLSSTKSGDDAPKPARAARGSACTWANGCCFRHQHSRHCAATRQHSSRSRSSATPAPA